MMSGANLIPKRSVVLLDENFITKEDATAKMWLKIN